MVKDWGCWKVFLWLHLMQLRLVGKYLFSKHIIAGATYSFHFCDKYRITHIFYSKIPCRIDLNILDNFTTIRGLRKFLDHPLQTPDHNWIGADEFTKFNFQLLNIEHDFQDLSDHWWCCSSVGCEVKGCVLVLQVKVGKSCKVNKDELYITFLSCIHSYVVNRVVSLGFQTT
jgi:hypothetical protein